jgi:hypothetical protein
MKIIDVTVTHDRPDLTGCAPDETAKKKKYFEGNPSNPQDFHYPTFVQAREHDLTKLVIYMRQNGIDLSFYDAVMAGTQNPWQRMRENDPNGQTGQFSMVTDAAGQTRMVKK